MKEFFNTNPYWGMLLTIGCYFIGEWVYNKTKITILQPILTASLLVIAFLTIGNISFEVYYQQNSILNYILPLTAVVLAVPLYKNLHILKRHAIPILAGIASGTVVTMLSVVAFGKLMRTDDSIIVSMIPKSATNPIAIEVSELIGGIPSLTVAMVVITGILGAVFGPEILKLMRIKNDVAKGIALGSMCHAVGTARAFKESEIQGSMSSLAMAIAGTLTAILSPLIALLVK